MSNTLDALPKAQRHANRKRSIPEDFALVAKDMTPEAASKFYGIGQALLYRWAKHTGTKFIRNVGIGNVGRRKTLIPNDFVLVSTSMTPEEAASFYGISRATFYRWIKLAGAKLEGGKKKKEIPDDFVQIAKNMTWEEASDFYGIGVNLLYRWVKETGAKFQRKHYCSKQEEFLNAHIDEIRHYATQPISWQYLSRIFKVSIPTIKIFCDENEIQKKFILSGRNQRNTFFLPRAENLADMLDKHREKFDFELAKIIRHAADEGIDVETIAKLAKCGPKKVRMMLEQTGVATSKPDLYRRRRGIISNHINPPPL